MRIDPSEFQIDTTPRVLKRRGGKVLALGLGAALVWIAASTAFAYLQPLNDVWFAPNYNTLIATAAFAVVPALLILFVAYIARETAAARSESEHLTSLAEASLALPSPAAATMAREISRSLRAELTALDGVVRAVAGRMDVFERALREDGGALARALAEDVRTLGAVRSELKAEAEALGADVSKHVQTMREATTLMVSETVAMRTGFSQQLDVFGAASAVIGKRSADFASAASIASGSAEKLDDAVGKALAALAHATSLTDSARQSAQAASIAANEAAGAVRETTRRAVAEVREAAKAIRAEARVVEEAPAPVPASASVGLRLAGLGAKENLIPRESVDVIVKPRPRSHTLADIVSASGVRVSEALSTTDLDEISRAAKTGPDMRRAAVRKTAPVALKKLSTHLRRNTPARHAAEALRREPMKALGDATTDRDTRRDLSIAYLLIDAVLG